MPSLFADETAVGYAQIAVERGIDRYPDGLTYGIPTDLGDLAPGDRVTVPLGRGDTPTPGYVVEIDAAAPERGAKLIAARQGRGLPASLVDLARWMSRYYCAPMGMTLMGMLPAAVKRNVGAVTRTLVDLAETRPEGKLPPKQAAVIELLTGLPPGDRPLEMRELADRAGLRTTGPLKRLLAAGHLTAIHRSTIEATWGRYGVDTSAPDALTNPQRTAVSSIGQALDDGFSVHLLHGVTGSGKTEVYIRLIERAVATDQVAIMLVPEIALTPQTGGRLIGRLSNERVAVLHSGLTAAQRHQQWSLVADGTARVVLGARSAVFAPVEDARIGLIIVDEEHDGSYKQDQTPRYHGRDVALRRAQSAGCPVVLGSATPSLESWCNAMIRRRFRLHQLPERVPGMRLPTVRVVDVRAERKAREERRMSLIGPTLETALRRTLSAGYQALLLLNRRGYASYISCPDQRCGWMKTCDECDVTMVFHKDRALPRGGFVQCHHCRSEQRVPATCPDCDRRVIMFGLGTQRVEEELARRFPELGGGAMVRVDSDTMQSARDFHDVLDRFGQGEIRLLVGTQMIAKGLDFPRVRLVGVIDADTAINLPDFRATERTFQLVSQVAGRCGRSTDPAAAGEVVVQSFNPDAPAIRLAARHDYRAFADLELAARRHGPWPPWSRLARIVVRDAELPACSALAAAAAEGLRSISGDAVRVIGPAPCVIARIASRHRQEILLIAPAATDIQRVLAEARNRGVLRPGAAMAVDVDPVALL